MRLLIWLYETFGIIGGIGGIAGILGIILIAAGGGDIGFPILLGGVVIVLLAKKFKWP